MAICRFNKFFIGLTGILVAAVGTTMMTSIDATASIPGLNTHVAPRMPKSLLLAQRWIASLIAYYPLRNNAFDATGRSSSITLVNAPFQDGGVYCNGVYVYNGSANPCNIITPQLKTLNFNSFSIGAKFKVSQYDTRPVFVGGDSYRWIGFYLSSDGKVKLQYNNSNLVSCNVTYRLNTWHRAFVTYNGSVGKLYLDGVLGCNIPFQIEPGNDKNVGVTDFSNGLVFKGVLKDLTIYNRPITPLR